METVRNDDAAFRGARFLFRAGPYRFVRDSCNGSQVDEYLLTVETSGVLDAMNRKSYVEVGS